MGRSRARGSADGESTALALRAASPPRGSSRHSRATVADEDHQCRASPKIGEGRSAGKKLRSSRGTRGNVPSRERRGMQPLPMDLEDPVVEDHADRRRGQRRRRRHGGSRKGTPGKPKWLPQCTLPAVVSGAFVLLLLGVLYFTPGSLSSTSGALALALSLIHI